MGLFRKKIGRTDLSVAFLSQTAEYALGALVQRADLLDKQYYIELNQHLFDSYVKHWQVAASSFSQELQSDKEKGNVCLRAEEMIFELCQGTDERMRFIHTRVAVSQLVASLKNSSTGIRMAAEAIIEFHFPELKAEIGDEIEGHPGMQLAGALRWLDFTFQNLKPVEDGAKLAEPLLPKPMHSGIAAVRYYLDAKEMLFPDTPFGQ